WAAAQETGMVVHIHAGWGWPQGSGLAIVQAARERVERLRQDAGHEDEPGVMTTLNESLESTFPARRPLWQLMVCNISERFAALKIAFGEIHGDWVPPTIDYLERLFDAGKLPIAKRPTEYWTEHCAIGASLMRYGEVRDRHAIGINQLMFGTDFPHYE